MKTKLFTLLLSCILLGTAKAQYINIPDNNFRSFLIAKYPTCFSGAGNMDTTCNLIVNADSLSCSNNFIASIEGIQYFDSLKYLNCNSNGLTFLPNLPNGLTYLNCGNNQLTFLPNLPNGLTNLACSNNQITILPTLPNGLTYLRCSGNKLTSLLTLPNTLVYLNCEFNNLTNLPTLSNGLTHLNCGGSNLTSLPTLPSGLTFLACHGNQLTSIPTLPNGLTYLNCRNNNIYCLPYLPITLKSNWFHFDKYRIECLPNPVYGLIYPVCHSINNVNGCPSKGFANVEGRFFYDANSNGIKDSIEIYNTNTLINFAGISSVISNQNGYYNFATDSLATHLLTPSPTIANTVCSPLVANITFNKMDTVATQNFAIQPTTIKDSIEVALTVSDNTRAGGGVWFNVSIKNAGTTNLTNVSSILNYDNTKVVFYTCMPFAFVNTGNSIIVNLPNIPFGGHYTYYGWLNTKTTVAISDTIKFAANTTGNALLANAYNYTLVRGSYDPNDKTATPELSTSQVADGKRIDYTVRFQNTGNDTAIHVVIADTLSNKLQTNSLQIIANSHDCRTTIKNGIIFFEMRNIMLPDSNVNKLASNGFIRFSMLPKTTVVAGDNLPNSAAIYFDYNAPIITNTAITQINNNVLPVQFTMYNVQCTNCENNTINQSQNSRSKLLLNSWTTANEINLSHFVIQRSTDGKVFKSVGSIVATNGIRYSFIDELITQDQLPKTLYYRLQSVDKDGRFSFSEVRKILFNKASTLQEFNFYPNPAKTFISFNIENLVGTGSVVITDLYGKEILTQPLSIGTNNVNINKLVKGLYFVSMITNEGKTTKKLVVE